MNAVGIALMTGLGLGRLRPAPGTIGSLPPAIIALILAYLLGPRIDSSTAQWIINIVLIAMAVVFTLICLKFGESSERAFGRKDPPDVVADEIAGQSMALLFLPWRDGPETSSLIWNLVLASTAFVAFRFTDIVKPPPARALQRLPSGAGIVVDDLIAGIYALVMAQLMARMIWPTILT